jgi:tetratricopeptide (TPR) repeat protein/tRNA A-37 threonylcarbamoyl transferase component Bud32/phage FluMu protein Com
MAVSCRECGKPIPGSGSRVAGSARAELKCPHCGTLRGFEDVQDTKLLWRGTAPMAARDGGTAPAPREFAGYEIDGELGRGAMGVVYKARDPELKRTIALKVLLAAEHASEEEIERFSREAASAARLQHPNIVPIHELKIHDGKHYYTMDYVEGEPLDWLISKQRFDVSQSLELILKVAQGLEHAHAGGIVHRDLKPQNIIVTPDGQPRITDFGLAKVLSSGEEDLTQNGLTETGAAIGTPHYMAPEQASGRSREVDVRSDIYSLGCILYEMLAGEPPFTADSVMDILRKHVEDDPLPVSRRGVRCPSDAETICLKCLEKDPQRRYQSAGELADDIRCFLRDDPITARRASLVYVVRKKLVRHKTLASVVSVAVALLVALTSWYILDLRAAKRSAEEQLAARLLLEQEKQQLKAATRAEARRAVDTGRAALVKATTAGAPRSRGNLLIQAQSSFRKALFLVPTDQEARKGMLDASLAHFELALEQQSWEQAREKLEAAHLVGLEAAEYTSRKKRLGAAESARENRIRGRVKHLFADARKLKRKVLHEHARAELISLKDPLTIELLLPHVGDEHPFSRKLAIESLGWMGDPRAVKTILPYIQKKCPDGSVNPESVQEVAIRAICLLAPDDLSVYRALRKRVEPERRGVSTPLYYGIQSDFKRYAAVMAPKMMASAGTPKGADLQREWSAQARLYFEAGKFDKAIACYDERLKLKPNDWNALVLRGRARARNGDTEGAFRDIKRALELNPKCEGAYTCRGWIKARLRKFDEAIADYDKALELNPRSSYAYRNRGHARYSSRDFAGAMQDYDKALKLNAKDAKAYGYRGWLKYCKRDYHGAISDFDKALEINPRSGGIYGNRATAKRAKGDFQGAILDFDKALELEPKNAMVYHNRAFAKRSLRDFDGAVRDLDKAIKLSPRKAQFYRSRAVMKQSKRDMDGALADYTTAIKLEPGDVRACGARGTIRRAQGDFKGAIQDFTRVLELSPRTIRAYVDRGTAKKKLRDLAGAIADYDKAIAMNPRYADAYHQRGHAREAGGELKKAIADFDKALEVSRKPGSIYKCRAYVKRELGDFKGAVRDLEAYIRVRGKASTYAHYAFFTLLITERQGGSKAKDVRAKAKAFRDAAAPRGWVGKLFAYFCGELNEADLIKAADSRDPKLRLRQTCEAYYHTGAMRLAAGEKARAIALFRKCVATRARRNKEYSLAVSALKKLGQAGKTSPPPPEDHVPEHF